MKSKNKHPFRFEVRVFMPHSNRMRVVGGSDALKDAHYMLDWRRKMAQEEECSFHGLIAEPEANLIRYETKF